MTTSEIREWEFNLRQADKSGDLLEQSKICNTLGTVCVLRLPNTFLFFIFFSSPLS